MITEKTFQGAWRFSELVGDWLFTMQYMGYTKKEAMRLFKAELKKLKEGEI